MNRRLIALPLIFVIFAASCGGPGATATGSPSATTVASSPTSTASVAPTASASPSTSTSASPIPLPNTAEVAAAGNGVVWMLVANTHLFRSTDRGGTWTERTLPPQLPNVAIAFVSDREGWIAASGSPATQCQTQKVAISRTTDGAATWSGIDTTGIADAQCKGAFAFSDAQHGYLSAWSQNDRPVIYRTADGGKTWSASAPLPDPADFTTQPGGSTLQAGPVADFGSVQLVHATGQKNGQQVGYVFRSTDGGATWSPLGATTPAMGIVFLTPTHWIQISTPGDSKETTDGGASWHGYATVRGGLSRTTDGGLHWTSLKTPGT